MSARTAPSTSAVVRVERVTRSFGQVVALNDVSIVLEPGLIGLLGPNGAGKSTLIKLISGELRPSLGEVEVLGYEPFANPDLYHRMGLCPEQEAVFEDLTGREFISFLLRLRGFSRKACNALADEWLDRMGLTEAAHRRLGGYSKGMRQRAKLATTLAHKPDLLLLDEPLTGLDPMWRKRIIEHMKDAAADGATVIFSSHVLHEVEQATRSIVLLYRGRLLAQGNAREIRALVDKVPHRIHLLAEEPRALAQFLIRWECIESVRVHDLGVDVTTPQPDRFYKRLTDEIASTPHGVSGWSSPDDSLHALFETLVG
jgi:ABC-2 type transport system ATP-binding protein